MRNRRVLCPPSEAYRNATSVAPVEAQGETAWDSKMHRHDSQTLHSTTCEAHPMPWVDPDEDTWTPWSTTRIPLSEDYRSVMAERAIFQVLASMGLPALTIHSVVKYSGRALKDAKSVMIRTWGPIGVSYLATTTSQSTTAQPRCNPGGVSQSQQGYCFQHSLTIFSIIARPLSCPLPSICF